MFIIAFLSLVVGILGVVVGIVAIVLKAQIQPDPSSSGMAIPDYFAFCYTIVGYCLLQ